MKIDAIAAPSPAPEHTPKNTRKTPSARPKSAVSTGVGLAGLVGMLIWFGIARYYLMSGPLAALVQVAACALPMVLWSIFIDKVHRNPTTGIDWAAPPRRLSDTFDASLAKLAGLWATWAIIGALYATIRFYSMGNYIFAMQVFTVGAVPLFVLSIPYILWIDTRMTNPKDGAWAFGSWLMGNRLADRSAMADHARSWAVKGFYMAFMLSIVPGNYANVVATRWTDIVSGPVALAEWLIRVMFLIDVSMGTVGYILTMKPLDAHIRSATPYASGWAAALMCYPPFVMIGVGAPFNYAIGTYGEDNWWHWFDGSPVLLWVWGGLLVGLTAIYAWATMAFGIRFSNLTHRGILTHGPYAWTKHPAYVSKNAFWWLASLPFLVTSGTGDAIRNTIIMAMVSGIYFWRAKTEEKHLGNDADYRAYAAWMKGRWRRA
jgi:protein-S-isoprenylcysteine O-methyltransferase Ste14